MSLLECIEVRWEQRKAKAPTVSDKGTAIESGDIYYQKIVDVIVGGRTDTYETEILTEKEHFIQRLNGEKDTWHI